MCRLAALFGGRGRSLSTAVRWSHALTVLLLLALVIPLRPVSAQEMPASDALTLYPMNVDARRIAVVSSQEIWFTAPANNAVGRLLLSAGGGFSVSFYRLPQARSQPHDIAYDGDGAVWFTERGNNQIGSIDVVSGELREHAIPLANSEPTGIDVDAGGRIWFVTVPVGSEAASNTAEPAARSPRSQPSEAESAILEPSHRLYLPTIAARADQSDAFSYVGQFAPRTGQFALYAYERAGAQFEDLSVRNAVWITAPNRGRVVKFDRGSLRFLEVMQPPMGSRPHNIVVTPAGIPWITNQGRNELALFLAGTLEIWLSFPYTGGDGNGDGHPVGIDHSIRDGADHIWFTDDVQNRVGLFVTRGNETLGPYFRDVERPDGIAVDDQGTAWIAVAGGIAAWRAPYGDDVNSPALAQLQSQLQ